jgi:hypothetical protein
VQIEIKCQILMRYSNSGTTEWKEGRERGRERGMKE